MQTPSILQKIITTKYDEVMTAKQKISYHDLEQQAIHRQADLREFAQALREKPINIIAEVKKASPSKGVICQNFDPVATAIAYEKAGASCLSVLTDVEYFQGSDSYLQQARQAVTLPVLRKDFMIDPYQIVESRALGADCILLIMACLSDAQAQELHSVAMDFGLSVLIECHDKVEAERALQLANYEKNIYGVNNRNLNNFVTDLNTTLELYPIFPKNSVIVSESGIHSVDDVKMMLNHQINCFLIGEQFMKTDNAGQALADLLKKSTH